METRQTLADALHSHAFAVTGDARVAAQVTDLMLAQIDRELTYYSVVDAHRALLRAVGGRSDHGDAA